MSQPVMSGNPLGYTPLHVLCHGSDALLAQRDIIISMVENNFVPVESFGNHLNDKVFV